MENLTSVIYTIVGLGTVAGAFKGIDWLIATKYKTKDECEQCRNTLHEIINKDRDLLVRVDSKMDIVLDIMKEITKNEKNKK